MILRPLRPTRASPSCVGAGPEAVHRLLIFSEAQESRAKVWLVDSPQPEQRHALVALLQQPCFNVQCLAELCQELTSSTSLATLDLGNIDSACGRSLRESSLGQ